MMSKIQRTLTITVCWRMVSVPVLVKGAHATYPESATSCFRDQTKI